MSTDLELYNEALKTMTPKQIKIANQILAIKEHLRSKCEAFKDWGDGPGCGFIMNLQRDLQALEEHFPGVDQSPFDEVQEVLKDLQERNERKFMSINNVIAELTVAFDLYL